MNRDMGISIYRVTSALALCASVALYIFVTVTIIFILSGFFRNTGITGSWEFATTEEYFFRTLSFIYFFLGTITMFMATPLGDMIIVQLLTGARDPDFNDPVEAKLIPIIDDIKLKYLKKFEEPLNINIHVIDSPEFNAWATGHSSISIYRGALEHVSDEELSGVICHEIGHLHYRDGSFNSLFATMSILKARIPSPLYMAGNSKSSGDPVSSVFGFIIFLIIISPLIPAIILFIPLIKIHFITADKGIWAQEYRADKFASDMGFNEGLISFLELIASLDNRSETGWLVRYKHSHPATRNRIKELRLLSVTKRL